MEETRHPSEGKGGRKEEEEALSVARQQTPGEGGRVSGSGYGGETLQNVLPSTPPHTQGRRGRGDRGASPI